MTLFSKTRRPGATLAGIVSLALASTVLLCGAGGVPIENFSPQGAMQADLNAGGHAITNAATVSTATLLVNGAPVTSGGGDSLPFTLPLSTVLAQDSSSNPLIATDSSGNLAFVNGQASLDASGDLTANGQFSLQGGNFYSSTDGSGNFLTLVAPGTYYQEDYINSSNGRAFHWGPYWPNDSFGCYSTEISAGVFGWTGNGQVTAGNLTPDNAHVFQVSASQGSLHGTSLDNGAFTTDGSGNTVLATIRFTAPPASSTAAGTAGQFAVDANYLYVCTAGRTWKRASLTSLGFATW